MPHFTQDFLNFFTELSENNNREWFEANKPRYKKNVEVPFTAFIGEMIERMQAIDHRIVLTAKDAVFRIYRDVRFSNDKTPYKDHVSAIISSGGRKGPTSGGAYFQFNHKAVGIYGGAYQPEKEAVQGIREAIASDLTGFQALLDDPDFKEKYGELHGEANKRLPPEFAEAAAKQPLLFKKSFYFFKNLPPETLLLHNLADLMMDYYVAGRPMMEFLEKASK